MIIVRHEAAQAMSIDKIWNEKTHDKWAQRLGISKNVSNYINRAIDNKNVPED